MRIFDINTIREGDRDSGSFETEGRIPDSFGRQLSPEVRAQALSDILKKLQGYAPSDEQLEEELGPSAGSVIGGPSGSFPQSLAPLQALQFQNPGNRLIELLLQLSATRKSEAGA